MIKKEVQFETITPLFTGDVNQEMTEIKPAGIMGSLRFWFEVICHFSGLFNDAKYSKDEFNYKKYEKFVKKNPDETDDEICDRLQLSPVARYFGCTGWKSRIGIDKIYP
ncbi:MAG: type III-B CRISPR module RAMP protein Cmr1, partial [Fidelibacterota bacterium]